MFKKICPKGMWDVTGCVKIHSKCENLCVRRAPKTTNQEDDSRRSFLLCPKPGAYMAQAYEKSIMSTPTTTVDQSTFAFDS